MYNIEEIKNKIILGDCLDELPKIPDNSIDMILTDPPYMISTEVKITRGRNQMKFKGKDLVMDFGDWDWFKDLEDYFEWTFKWIDECVRVLKDGRMFITYFDKDKINFLSYYLQKKYKFKIKGYFADCKSNPVPQARKVKWQNGWEIIGLWQKPNGKLIYHYELGQHKDYGIRPIVGGKERTSHPTQKPLSVIKDFILWWSNENDIILDPFIGSGTTAVACKMLNRNYIGIDKNSKFCIISEERLNNVPEYLL